MPVAFYHEQTVDIDGEKLTLAINFKALDATEQLMKADYDTILKQLQQKDCPVGISVKVIWGLLREHHPEIDLDQIVPMTRGKNGIKTGLAVQQLLEAAFPEDDGQEAKDENPPQPHGA